MPHTLATFDTRFAPSAPASVYRKMTPTTHTAPQKLVRFGVFYPCVGPARSAGNQIYNDVGDMDRPTGKPERSTSRSGDHQLSSGYLRFGLWATTICRGFARIVLSLRRPQSAFPPCLAPFPPFVLSSFPPVFLPSIHPYYHASLLPLPLFPVRPLALLPFSCRPHPPSFPRPSFLPPSVERRNSSIERERGPDFLYPAHHSLPLLCP